MKASRKLRLIFLICFAIFSGSCIFDEDKPSESDLNFKMFEIWRGELLVNGPSDYSLTSQDTIAYLTLMEGPGTIDFFQFSRSAITQDSNAGYASFRKTSDDLGAAYHQNRINGIKWERKEPTVDTSLSIPYIHIAQWTYYNGRFYSAYLFCQKKWFENGSNKERSYVVLNSVKLQKVSDSLN